MLLDFNAMLCYGYVVKDMLEPTVRQLQFNNIIYKRTPEIYLQYHNHIHTRPHPIFIQFEFNLITMLKQNHEKIYTGKKMISLV